MVELLHHASLRRHYPHQVQRVYLTPVPDQVRPRTPNVLRLTYSKYGIITRFRDTPFPDPLS